MSAKVALGKHQDPSGSMRFKLVKGSAHDCEPAPFSDSIHNSLEVSSLRDPYTLDMSDEVGETFSFPHILLRILYFIYDK